MHEIYSLLEISHENSMQETLPVGSHSSLCEKVFVKVELDGVSSCGAYSREYRGENCKQKQHLWLHKKHQLYVKVTIKFKNFKQQFASMCTRVFTGKILQKCYSCQEQHATTRT